MLIWAPNPRWPRPELLSEASCCVLTELTPACRVAAWVQSRPFEGRSRTVELSWTPPVADVCDGLGAVGFGAGAAGLGGLGGAASCAPRLPATPITRPAKTHRITSSQHPSPCI